MSDPSLSLLSLLSLTTRRPISLFCLSLSSVSLATPPTPSLEIPPSRSLSLSPLSLLRPRPQWQSTHFPRVFSPTLTHTLTLLPVACPLKGDPSSQRLYGTPNRLTLVAFGTHPFEAPPPSSIYIGLQPFPFLWLDFLFHALRLATILIRTVIWSRNFEIEEEGRLLGVQWRRSSA
jgi:hypothetical protein